MIDGQMTVEEVIEDIEQDRDSRRVYIPLLDIHYEGYWPLQVEGDKIVMGDGPIQGYATREEAQAIAKRAASGSSTSPEVWEIVLPAEKLPTRGESESGPRG